MTFIRKISVIAAAFACLPSLCATSSGQVVEEIIARVNNQIITRSEYDAARISSRTKSSSRTPTTPKRIYPERKKMFSAISSTSSFSWTKARIWASPPTRN